MKKWSIYICCLFTWLLFRSVVIGKQVYGAIEDKAEGP